jgi:hypothetical protein
MFGILLLLAPVEALTVRRGAGASVLTRSVGRVHSPVACTRASEFDSLASPAGDLVGTRWTLLLDVGPEKGTWMPPSWGRSGARARPKVRVQFDPDGELRILETGAYDRRTVEWDGAGSWSLDQRGAVQFWLPHKGLARDDVVLESGKLWFSAPAWGVQLSKRGNLTIKQSKLGWLPFLPTLPGTEGSFMVGTFRTVHVEEGDPPLGA